MVNLLTDLGKSHSDIRLLYTGPKMHAEAERLSENVKSESRVGGGGGGPGFSAYVQTVLDQTQETCVTHLPQGFPPVCTDAVLSVAFQQKRYSLQTKSHEMNV